LDEVNKKRLRWHARRGLLELDLLLQRFFAQRMEQLDAPALAALYTLLLLPDLTLLEVCQGKTHIDDVQLQKIIMLIRETNKV
jgi:succinate dehydrogenase flavin-adding protein (antitoxin of CptAB toxin-antitoxin module)